MPLITFGELFHVLLLQMSSSNGDYLECEVCGVASSSAYSLKRHMQLHSGSTTCAIFQCAVKHSKHTRSPTDSPKLCSQCGKVCTTTFLLNKHENELHLGKASTYSCKLCAEPCQSRYAFQQYISTHSNETDIHL